MDRLCRAGILTGVLDSSFSLSSLPIRFTSSESWAWLLPPLTAHLCCCSSSLRRRLVLTLDSAELTCAFVTLLTTRGYIVCVCVCIMSACVHVGLCLHGLLSEV